LRTASSARHLDCPYAPPAGCAQIVLTYTKCWGGVQNETNCFVNSTLTRKYSDGSSECVAAAICRTTCALRKAIGLRRVSSSPPSNSSISPPAVSISRRWTTARICIRDLRRLSTYCPSGELPPVTNTVSFIRSCPLACSIAIGNQSCVGGIRGRRLASQMICAFPESGTLQESRRCGDLV